jgi:ABC-2 type transport system ATP-binding protein
LAIIDHGRVIALGRPAELKRSIPGGFLLRLRFGSPAANLLERLQSLIGVREVRAADTTGADVYADRGGSLIAEIAAVAAATGAELSDVHICPVWKTCFCTTREGVCAIELESLRCHAGA